MLVCMALSGCYNFSDLNYITKHEAKMVTALLYSIQDYDFVGGHCSGGKVHCYNNKQTGVEIYGNFVHSMDPNVACISDFKFKTDEQQKGFFY